MKKGGTGGSNTKTGLDFEEKTNLEDLLKKIEGIKIFEENVYYNHKKIAEIYQKYKLYNILCKKLNINWKKKISARLLPDECYYKIKEKNLIIIEKKFQSGGGSVEEKLQTCDFKKKQYEKLFENKDIKVDFWYVLNKWYKNDRFKDVHNYIEKSGCEYFFHSIPLDKLL